MSEITSPPVRYTGSKWRIAPWVISHFPKHVCYVEPFCGGAAVLFRKQPSQIEVINDLNKDVVNFFDILRERPNDLIRAIELTPHSRYELERALIRSDDSLENARRFYIRARQSIGSGETSRISNWRFQKNLNRKSTTITEEWNKIDHLWSAVKRLKSVAIENSNSLDVIDRFDTIETLIYCDPPYVTETRIRKEDYPFEMTDEDHINLSKKLHNVQGMAIISGYDCTLYRDLYSDWKLETKQSVALEAHYNTECLWISPAAQRQHPQRRMF